MTDRIEKMVNHILTETIYPPTKEVAYDRADYLLPERYMQSKRICDYMIGQDVVIPEGALLAGMIRFNSCPYPSDVMSKAGFANTIEIQKSFFNTTTPFEDFKFWGWQHATADFGKIIDLGIEGIKEQIAVSLENHKGDADKEEFLNSCLMICDGIIAYELKVADTLEELSEKAENEKRKQELSKMAENLRHVPRYPAGSFYEAVQSLYFCFDFVTDSIGLPDRWLYKYYKQDKESGAIDDRFATELLQELFIKIQSNTPLTSENFTKGGQNNFSLGGYNENGDDCYNELSELILNALLDLPLYIPQVTFRWTKKTPFELFYHIMDLERKDKHQRIAFVNDEVKIKCLMENCSIPWEEAVKYVTIGCNMIALSGGMWYGTGYANQVKPLNETLYSRKADVLKCKTFEEFYSVYEEELYRHLNRDIEVGTMLNRYVSKDECVLGSIFLNGCIESGKSLNKGGANGISEIGGGCGLMCSIDSLAIIKQFVYDEKTVTMEEMLSALEADFKGYEDLYTMIMKKGKFFGNDDEETNEVARLVTTSTHNFAKDKTDIFGKHFIGVVAPGYRAYHSWFGSVTGATPDGRHKGEPFKTIGTGQTEGRDRNGLTALLNSVAGYDPSAHFSGVTVTNINVDSKLIYDDENFVKTVKLIETYFNNGGAQIQINSVSPEDLIAAKHDPKKYKSLRVRVSGFSDYFVNLGEEMQDNIIKRTSIA